MKLLISNTKNNPNTISLQYIGHVFGTPAMDLKVGDTLVWNAGEITKVVEILKETSKTITVKMSYKSGFWTKKMKKSTIVARPANELPEEIKKMAGYKA